ncbi:nickel pincer cofactor biosynthesis protein LarC [Phormidium sp. CLA17]|uniref:nickel pincer cofactor biosynthesis protein LarC n=1 Tax=Leptolyngbya sp. Cla-17 TaxID=2803751 RepID=UPI001490CCD8|nr:nickel pincer cofactor biosynthesis protein LarC [Leptolyngbya sp. Cla-17]MBM0740502.1 nickel pincer cofactor biosynthesis protein LarC [Leptolyngbya sp. Cla-17]
MTKIAYLQCPTGIAGDMCLGALVDLGVPISYLIEQLGRLGISQEYKLWTESVDRNGQRATKFHVDLVFESGEVGNPDEFTTFDPHPYHLHSATEGAVSKNLIAAQPHEHGHSYPHNYTSVKDSAHSLPPIRHLPEIERLIVAALLPTQAEAWSLAVFRQLATAEAAVHGVSIEQVHFHEVGATDAIVDIVGTCLGLDWLGIEELHCSALPVGGGTIRAAHGRLPVPTPAVLKLFEMRQVPIYYNDIDRELVTPTGAAIATTIATHFGSPPMMTLHKVGLGAGTQNLSIANMLRLWVGEMRSESGGRKEEVEVGNQQSHTPHAAHRTPHSGSEAITVLETQIDDLNPQAIAYVMGRLLAMGALDVFTQAITMKKSRLGTLLTVICRLGDEDACEAMIFRETTTLGIRRSQQQRRVLPREIESVETNYGTVRVKVAWATGRDRVPTNVQPEYDDCAQIAHQQNIPWREVHRATLEKWRQMHEKQEMEGKS